MGSNDKTADSPLVLGCAGVFALVVVLFCVGGLRSCGGPAERSPVTGDDAVLRSTSVDQVPVARTREYLDRLADLAAANDTTGISHMLLAGQIWMVPNGTKCKVIKTGFTVYEVRLTEGSYSGQSGFVIREVVKSP